MDLTREDASLSRREVRRNDRRDAMLAVAYDYFLEHGYAATSMSGIAATLGGSKATLWSYFPSKEALFEAVLDYATTMFRQQISVLLETGGEPEPTLRSFARRFIERVTAPQAVALQRLVLAEVGRFPEIGEIFYERGPRTTYQLLGNFIATAMARGQLRQDDPLRAAKMLIALCTGGCLQLVLLDRIDAPAVDMIGADADAAVDFFLRGYAPD
ncbi:TetR/AcrR family transcriptional regulator [Rhizorhabdus dicambivorans]|uniref:TetR/AcrR family transcriptional regulator n=1 Tax=Rhizorhabdus dicambivorans TaxID=1850238 RepID=A0A2A4FV93_9SPHN|nr:TetR/AcrR family transcriptional regulator [Rhizorhabdus dicambivorans]ATE64546.1 TetR/AcrR family transcriptional regulator [Rhizorhabdus dicambivorans]PCE41640.1 TetR/AcrR family transcriptional regulator [Rhizorhabdus dicambivorans]